MLIEAGCKVGRWENNNLGEPYKYKWAAAGSLLETGACIATTYKKYRVPKKGKTRVFSTIEYQQVREVDAKKKTLLIDFTLTMRWLDSRIRRSRFSEENENEEIFLGPNAIDQIWVPDFRITNQTAFKPQDEWFSIVSAGVLGGDATNKLVEMNKDDEDKISTGARIQYEIKTSVFCPFQYAAYPMDHQKCTISFGSGSFGAIFTLADHSGIHHTTKTYEAANFDVTVKFFDSNLTSGKNTIGMEIELNRLSHSYIMMYYIPSILIVLVSEIGFVVPVTAIPGRIGLLVTQFLTLINLFIYQMVSFSSKCFAYS